MNSLQQMMVVLVLLGCLAPHAPGQAERPPHIGFVFPAGACSGTTTEVLVAGQNLRGASEVVVSGSGVSARVLKTYRAVRNLDKDQREEIQRRIAARRAVLAGRPEPPVPARAKDAPPLVMPPLYFLDRVARADAEEIMHLVEVFRRSNKKQVNTQLGEMVSLEVTVAPTAVQGPREVRLLTPAGLTNPLRFETGGYAEISEREPNDPKPGAKSPAKVAGLPVTFNGQVLPGDVDRLRFHARRGQNLVVEVQARSLIPYLADAVPGWFQPVLSVLDPGGKELAYADDFRFLPDPVLLFRVVDDGDYTLEVRDSIFRGREDFVYRIKVSEQPFITACQPLGAAAGSDTPCALVGWNLPQSEARFDTRPGGGATRELTVSNRGMVSNPVRYAVDDLPDAAEGEPNDSRDKAREVPWPCVVNGSIHKPGDIDVFRLGAPAGAEVMVEVWARRLGSALDSVVRVTDAAGKVLAWNDDTMPKDGQLQLGDGLMTHHADSRVSVKLPTEGAVFVQVEDAQHQGGQAFAYRLRISQARPDFSLRVTPSSLNLAPGQSLPVTVHVERRDGFSGPVTVGLAGAPAGWSVSGPVVPAGHERLRMTVRAAPNATAGVIPLRLTGTAMLGGVEVTKVAEACDDTMQAFLWRHLVPARECLAAVLAGKWRGSFWQRVGEGGLDLPAGGEALVRYRVPPWILQQGAEVVALELPDGVTMRSESQAPDQIVVHFKAEAGKVKIGDTDNLILSATMKQDAPAKANKKPDRMNRGATPVVVLPALPVTIQAPTSKP